jgi:hypothetical protein
MKENIEIFGSKIMMKIGQKLNLEKFDYYIVRNKEISQNYKNSIRQKSSHKSARIISKLKTHC